ncbi:MAG: TIGR00266 family protein [Spirochaetaceae bacterium]|jgi:uncharacterized protein (TIGR00266 family)|nr:TIGR00266 family protein [Spirochaetaceae bacterium]
MNYSIENQPVFTSITVKLEAGETIKAEGGAMISMTTNIGLKSKTAGKGLGGMLKAAVGGEGLMQSHFTAENGPGEVTFAPPTPGDIVALDVGQKTILAQSGAWIAGSSDVEMSAQGSFKAMMSGEGLFLQKLSGAGTVFLSSYGAVVEKYLAAGESIVIDTGNMVAYEEGVTSKIKKAAKGLFATVASGEGLVGEFTGPGKVWMQTRNLKGFAELLMKLAPKK